MSVSGDSRIDERDHDVARASCGGQTLVLVRQTSRVHQRPALAQLRHGAVVAREANTTALERFHKSVHVVMHFDRNTSHLLRGLSYI